MISFFCIPGGSVFSRIWKHPKFQHFKLVFLFILFNVFFVAADVVTDILTAADLFSRGDFYWGLFTCFPIFAPFVAHIFLALNSLQKCFQIKLKQDNSILRRLVVEKSSAKLEIELRQLPELVWKFPLLHPLR